MPDKVDDFNVFTVEDRQSVSYGLCIAGTAVVGAAVGRIAGLSGVLVGAAGGLLWGLLVCKQVSPVIERKLLSANEELTEGELLSLIGVIRQETGVKTKSEAMYLLGQVRAVAANSGEKGLASENALIPPRAAAAQLLRERRRRSA